MTTELIISISATVTAIAALFVAVWQGILSRNHNKISVRPKLNFHSCLVDNDDFIGIRLRNDGIGPAVIKVINVYLDDEYKGNASYNNLDEIAHKINGGYRGMGFYGIFQDESIRVGDSMHIFYLDQSDKSPRSIKRFSEDICRLRFEVEYQSMYEEKFYLSWQEPKKKMPSNGN